jgi:2-polyprenyl-6-methoxyphenol hydroxylase-like FAD-dependent oxidoreductase
MRAAVIGGGIAGLSAAIALRKAGYAVTLFERAPKLEPIGAALSVWGNAMAGLDWLDCGEALRALAAPISGLLLSRLDGRALFGPVDEAAADGYLALRADLQRTLLAKLGRDNCRFDTQIDDVVETGGKVIATCAGQPVGEADLAIVADGVHSALATRLLGNAPVYRGYGGVLGLGQSPDDGRMPGLGQEMWDQQDRFGLFDCSGGARYWFYMASLAQPADVARLNHAMIVSRAAHWPAEFQAAVAATDPEQLIRVPIHSRPLPRTLGRGRIVCVGDAAHAMEPNHGQGACQGIEDAWLLGLLAQRLRPDAILAEFERRRLPRIRTYWRESALVGMAAHSRSQMVRTAGRTVFSMFPRWLEANQIKRRHAPPNYR